MEAKRMTSPTYRLLLHSMTLPDCTIGKLYVEYKATKERMLLCYILENPWLNNQTSISCVPAGQYLIKPTISPKFGETYYLESIKDKTVGLTEGDRTHILIHAGNTVNDTSGCLLTGNTTGVLEGKRAVLDSKHALKDLLKVFDGYDYRLDIIRN